MNVKIGKFRCSCIQEMQSLRQANAGRGKHDKKQNTHPWLDSSCHKVFTLRKKDRHARNGA